MSSLELLHFLRPYAIQPLSIKKTAYLRVYHCVRHGGLASRSDRKSFTTSLKRRHDKKDDIAVAEDSHAARSHAISLRIQELSLAGALAYPRIQSCGGHMRIPAFRAKYKDVSLDSPGQEEVVLRGRLQSIRRASSKLVFLDLMGEFEHVQGLCNFRKLEPSGATLDRFKALSKLLKRGDVVSITGKALRTPTGELTIEATSLPELLSPSLVPLPVKLADEDTRIQHRHIDLLVNRPTADVLRLRSYIIKYMRDFFHEKDFLEFQTPILAENAGGAVARPFVTASTEFNSKELSLRIAPELWLKRLVVGGVEKVFEIGPAFRNEGIDSSHNPEFTMCESYNAFANLSDLISQTEKLVSGLAEHCQGLISAKLTSLPPVDLGRYARPYRQVEFIPALESALGFRLPDLAAADAPQRLRALLTAHGIPLPAEDSPGLAKLLDKLAGTYLEPGSADAPLFITHHPACMSPLSKGFTCPRTGQLVSARAELFVAGRELANMYEEENDPFAQRRKFLDQAQAQTSQQQQHRDRDSEPSASPDGDEDGGGGGLVVDESYVQALESGLPPTGGWGCGVDRLVMLFSGSRRIGDCLSFGTLRNVVGLSAGARKTGGETS